MKHMLTNKTSAKILIMLMSILNFIGCDAIDNYIPQVQSCSCNWNSSTTVKLVYPQLLLPTTSCEQPFTGGDLDFIFPATSFYDIMSDMPLFNYYTIDQCKFSWVASVVGKQCISGTPPTDSVNLDQNDFGYRLYSAQNMGYNYVGDVLMEAPMNHPYDISRSDMKHTLTFQLFNVYNSFDGTTGTLTWTNSWIGENGSLYISDGNCWEFYFRTDGIYGSYNPTSGQTRYIYVHNQFDFL